MGLEHFEGRTELNQSAEPMEHTIENMESERPSAFELPHLAVEEAVLNDAGERAADDSNRESIELPQIEDKYYSTYEERMNQTPTDDGGRGEWSAERGESDFTPNDEEVKDIIDQYDKESITYKDAIPDFSEVAESTVEIDNMTANRADNFKQCDEKCAKQWNEEGRDGRTDWTARDVKDWREENEYTWHERNDMKTCDLVPTKVNDCFGHLGGVAECKKRDSEKGGNDFDE